MPSLDIVSEVQMHEVVNAVDQSKKEILNRFDFKGSNAKFEQNKDIITLSAKSDFFLEQMVIILKSKLCKRNVDISCLKVETPKIAVHEARQDVIVQQGIEQALAKKIVKLIKETKIKVQAAIQGDKIRVTGKKRDDLQAIMASLRDADMEIPLQFNNFHD
ncbi:MAG: YajQ family cyclic di-GMP-binding protein [Candidatus Anammoxibacter sp.]